MALILWPVLSDLFACQSVLVVIAGDLLLRLLPPSDRQAGHALFHRGQPDHALRPLRAAAIHAPPHVSGLSAQVARHARSRVDHVRHPCRRDSPAEAEQDTAVIHTIVTLPFTVRCPACTADPGDRCTTQRRRGYHLARADKAVRADNLLRNTQPSQPGHRKERETT